MGLRARKGSRNYWIALFLVHSPERTSGCDGRISLQTAVSLARSVRRRRSSSWRWSCEWPGEPGLIDKEHLPIALTIGAIVGFCIGLLVLVLDPTPTKAEVDSVVQPTPPIHSQGTLVSRFLAIACVALFITGPVALLLSIIAVLANRNVSGWPKIARRNGSRNRFSSNLRKFVAEVSRRHDRQLVVNTTLENALCRELVEQLGRLDKGDPQAPAEFYDGQHTMPQSVKDSRRIDTLPTAD